MLGHSPWADPHVELFSHCLTQQGGRPEAIFTQFLAQELFHLRCDQQWLPWGLPIGKPHHTVLFKPGEIVVDCLRISFKVLRELCDGPSRAVQAE